MNFVNFTTALGNFLIAVSVISGAVWAALHYPSVSGVVAHLFAR